MSRHPDPEKDEPVSLAPLDYETALRALLAVDPESEPVSEDDEADTDADPGSDRPEA